MTLDVEAGPPRSVELQREIEAVLAELRDLVSLHRLVGLGIFAGVVYAITTGNVSSTTSTASSATAWHESVTLLEVARFTGYVVAFGVGTTILVSIHELCHWLAFRRFGVPARWTLFWPVIRGRKLYLVPTMGLCWPVSERKAYALSYWEDAVVSLAPLGFTAIVLTALLAYHVLVGPLPKLGWVFGGVVLATGPSPPDYATLLRTPRERWEDFVALERSIERHALTEGYETPV